VSQPVVFPSDPITGIFSFLLMGAHLRFSPNGRKIEWMPDIARLGSPLFSRKENGKSEGGRAFLY
jgi:hypothetical protein